MLKLARAELYRFKNSGPFSKLLVLVSLLLPIITFALSWALKLHDQTLDLVVSDAPMVFLMIISLAFATILCVYVGTAYNSRLAYYEIMDGNSPAKIVLTKIMSLGLVASLIAYVPFALFMGVVAAVNGVGAYENPVLMFVMVFVIVFHVVTAAILYSMLARNLILSSFVPYIRFGIIDMIGYMVIETWSFASGKELPAIIEFFLNRQLEQVFGISYTNEFIVATLVSTVAEITILSVLVMLVYKRKKFK